MAARSARDEGGLGFKVGYGSRKGDEALGVRAKPPDPYQNLKGIARI
jgi:hypothetical protein